MPARKKARKQEKILITGAGGFVGQALSKELLGRGHDLILAGRKKMPAMKNAKALYGDLEDESFCKKILKNTDAVFYLAAYKKNIAVHTREPFETFKNNVRPLLVFLEAAKKSQVKNIVYVSSTNVEYISDQKSKIDGYVAGKYVNELAIKSFVQETGIPVKVVRSAAIYGPGDNFDPATANFIPSVIQKADLAKDEFEVWGTGERQLQYIYISDLVENLIAVLGSSEDFFTFGNPEVVSVNNIVERIIRLIGKKLKMRHDTSKLDKPTKLSAFNNLSAPKVMIEEGLKETFFYYKKHHA